MLLNNYGAYIPMQIIFKKPGLSINHYLRSDFFLKKYYVLLPHSFL